MGLQEPSAHIAFNNLNRGRQLLVIKIQQRCRNPFDLIKIRRRFNGSGKFLLFKLLMKGKGQNGSKS